MGTRAFMTPSLFSAKTLERPRWLSRANQCACLGACLRRHALGDHWRWQCVHCPDISTCSPHVKQAGSDCIRPRLVSKLDYCGPHLPSLLRQNISCTPIVWSAYGRPHQDTLTALQANPSHSSAATFQHHPGDVETDSSSLSWRLSRMRAPTASNPSWTRLWVPLRQTVLSSHPRPGCSALTWVAFAQPTRLSSPAA